jgi:hypothetical protein
MFNTSALRREEQPVSKINERCAGIDVVKRFSSLLPTGAAQDEPSQPESAFLGLL